MKNQKGFSFLELLIVVIIIAIISAMAIPHLLASRRAANQSATLADLRTLHSAEAAYVGTSGHSLEFGTLAELNASRLIDNSWLDGIVTKNTYSFTHSIANNASTYCLIATSSDASAKDYGIDQRGVLFEGNNGAVTCLFGVLGGVTTVVGSN